MTSKTGGILPEPNQIPGFWAPQDRSGQCRIVQDSAGHLKTAQDSAGQLRIVQDSAGVRAAQKSGQLRTVKYSAGQCKTVQRKCRTMQDNVGGQCWKFFNV